MIKEHAQKQTKISFFHAKISIRAKYAAVKNWNEIPVEIKTSISINTFRNKYKDHLLKQ